MDTQREDRSIKDLVRQLTIDGRAYASAELGVYKQKALAWVPPVRSAAIMLAVALFLVQAALTTLLIFIGFWLAVWLGPLGGGIAATAIALLLAGLLAKTAIGRLKPGAGI